MDIELSQLIEYLYPGALEAETVRLQDDGAGPYISYWDQQALGPRPTQAQLDAVKLSVAKVLKKRELRRIHEQQYATLFSLEGQFMQSESDWLIIREARQGYANLTAGEKAKVDQRQALRTKLLGLVDQVNAAASVEAIEPIVWA